MSKSYHPPPPSSEVRPGVKGQKRGQRPAGTAASAVTDNGKLTTPIDQPFRRPIGAVKRWTMEQLRASDAIIPLQSGTNQFASQRGMTGFGQPRNTITPVNGGIETPPTELDTGRPSDALIPLQYGTNRFASQRGMTGFGVPRDVIGKHMHRIWEDECVPTAIDE